MYHRIKKKVQCIYLNIGTFLWYNRPKNSMSYIKRAMSMYTTLVDCYQYVKNLCGGSQQWIFNKYLDEQIISVRYVDLETRKLQTLYNVFYPWMLPLYCLMRSSPWHIFKYGFAIKRVPENSKGLYEFTICHKGALLTLIARREQILAWIENKEFEGVLDIVDHQVASDYIISSLSHRHKAQVYVAQAGEIDITESVLSLASSFNKDSALTAEEFYTYLASTQGKHLFPETKDVVLNIVNPDSMDSTAFKDKDVIVLID